MYTPKDEADWLKKRFNGIGASESASVLGVSKWKSVLELYYEKVQKKTFGDTNSSIMRAGNFLEPSILKWFEADTGVKTTHNKDKKIYTNADRPHIFCTPDGFTIHNGDDGFCEAKLSPYGKMHGMWDDGIPLIYQIQLQHQMLCGELDMIYFAALINDTLMTEEVYRNDRFIKSLVSKLDEFWERVQNQEPPDPTVNDWSFLNSLYSPRKGVVIDLPDNFVSLDEELVKIKNEITELTNRKKEIEVQFKHKIADAEQGNLSSGVKYTFKESERKGHVVKPSVSRTLKRKGN